MSHQVLARKWRPQNFAQVVGQQHALKALTHAFNETNIHHAYLLTGTRGVGKTSIARIIAKALNCEKGISASPCGVCSACTSIATGNFVDLIEIDAASRTRVEDTRELLDNVQYLPTQGRYKVYLIDEVHMLSNHSFNALLKTLEEPPAHVVFLLATTDPQKLPATVLSRCLQFHLHNLLPEQIAEQLQHILTSEAISFESDAITRLSLAARGSMRDALSLLDQAIATGQGKVTADGVLLMLGGFGDRHLQELLTAIQNKDAASIHHICETMAVQGHSFEEAFNQLMTAFHDIALLQALPKANENILQNRQYLLPFTTTISKEEIQLFYEIVLLGQKDLMFAPSMRIGFEMSLLRIIAFRPQQTITRNSTEEMAATNDQTHLPAHVATVKEKSEKKTLEKDTAKIVPPPFASDIIWEKLIKELALNGMGLLLAQNCIWLKKENAHIYLQVDPKQQALNTEMASSRIKAALTEYFKENITLHIEAGSSNLPTPASQLAQKQEATLDAVKKSLNEDKNFQTILEEFGATIIPGSIKPHDEKP